MRPIRCDDCHIVYRERVDSGFYGGPGRHRVLVLEGRAHLQHVTWRTGEAICQQVDL